MSLVWGAYLYLFQLFNACMKHTGERNRFLEFFTQFAFVLIPCDGL